MQLSTSLWHPPAACCAGLGRPASSSAVNRWTQPAVVRTQPAVRSCAGGAAGQALANHCASAQAGQQARALTSRANQTSRRCMQPQAGACPLPSDTCSLADLKGRQVRLHGYVQHKRISSSTSQCFPSARQMHTQATLSYVPQGVHAPLRGACKPITDCSHNKKYNRMVCSKAYDTQARFPRPGAQHSAACHAVLCTL